MGTTLDMVIPGMDESRMPMLMRSLRDELRWLESLFSNYDKDSVVSRFNRSEPGSSFTVGEPLYTTVTELLDLMTRTQGLFDFTLGAWTSQPDKKGFSAEKLHTFCQLPFQERISMENGSLKRLRSETIIDSGGFGKGIALRSVEKILRDAGISSAFISFGRSSVLAIGSHPQGDTWKVGIQHPEDEQITIGTVDLVDGSLSVSGNSLNNQRKFGTGGHVLNPVSSGFIQRLDQVVAVSSDPLLAEVMSTARFAAMDRPEEEIITAMEGVEFFVFKSERNGI